MVKWVETWKRAGEELETLRTKHLREQDDTPERLAHADELITMALKLGRSRTTSGLVEQQRLFKKLAK